MKISKLIKTTFFVFLLTSLQSAAQGSDLFISEYIEGKNNNRAIEIYNPTDNPIDLSSYSLKQSYNGKGFGNSDIAQNDTRYILPLTGTLEPKEVLVLANGWAVYEITSVADFTYTFEANISGITIPGCNVLTYSGNDAIGLFKNDVLIDVVGVENEAPQDGWEVASLEKATKDHVLVRKGLNGNTDWAVSAGSDYDDSEWYVFDADEFSYLGWHISTSDIEGNISDSVDKIRVYPNPATDFITVDLTERVESIYLMNSVGRIIQKIKPQMQQHKIDVSAYAPGIYFIGVKKAHGMQSFKIIIQ